MKIFNSLSEQKEILPSHQPLRIFVCGPTVYNYIHIGNARTYAFFDIFVNYLRLLGHDVHYLQNITDIDDKIIKISKQNNVSPIAYAKKYEKAYHEDEKSLKINTVTKYARATDHIPEIIKQIQVLIDKGCAYEIKDDGYYFDIKKFPEYGKLSKRTVEQAEDATSRIDEGVNKRNRGDFALWKFSTTKNIPQPKNNKIIKKIFKGEPVWWTSLGWGRPGWHIEDTAITEKYFGPQYEIHGGAIDLKFPHHEAEIAQQESASGKKPLVKIWMHAGFLYMNEEKMSKSLGNFITIRDFVKNYSANVFRYIVASHHYRSSLNYSDQLIVDAKKTLAGVNEFIIKLSLVKKSGEQTFSLQKYESAFNESMENDFNSPEALSIIFKLINDVNIQLTSLTKKDAQNMKKWIINRLTIFKIYLKELKIPAKIKALAKNRELLRNHKQFTQGDLLRKEIEALGYKIDDTKLGTLIFPKE